MDDGNKDEAENVVLVGGGRMGAALLRGWLDSGISPRQIEVIEPHPSDSLKEMCRAHGVTIAAGLTAPVKANVWVLAVKPQGAGDLAKTLRDQVNGDAVILSIMAGVTMRTLREMFPQVAGIIRAMPNLAVAVGAGVTVATAEEFVAPAARTLAERLLSASGLFEWLEDEEEIDGATAISGSGPAYVFLFTECLAEAGVRLGLDPSSARRQARQTVIGAARLLETSPLEPSQLRQQVTSPGGTTEAAINALYGSLHDLMERATSMAAARSRALGR